MKNLITRFTLLAAVATSVSPAHADEQRVRDDPRGKLSAAGEPDNTVVNTRDRDDTQKTPFDQSNERNDVELTAKLRRAIVDDKTLSTNAHNIKIVLDDGKVTLRGPVNSTEERERVTAKVKAVLSKNSPKMTLTNQLEVAQTQ